MSETATVLTDKQVRTLFASAYAWRIADDVADGETDLSGVRAQHAAEFDAWLAAVIARAKREERERIADDLAALVAEVERLRTGTDWSQGDEWKRGYEVGCEASHNIGCDAVVAQRDQLMAENDRLRIVTDILTTAPDPRCDVHPDDDDPVTCGRKNTVTRARDALDAGGEQ